MKKRNYIYKAKNAILNRARFHAPIMFDEFIDKNVLLQHNVQLSLPIFKFDKTLNNRLICAFKIAQKEEKFNLVLDEDCISKKQKKKLQKLQNVVFYSKNSPLRLIEAINKLNINYAASSNYNPIFKEKFFKVNGQILNPSYSEFCLQQVYKSDGIVAIYNEFVLNGSNYFLKLKNDDNLPKVVEVEFNLPLKRGYYFFKRGGKSLLIKPLISKEQSFLNFFCKNAKFCFSCVDGLENSVFCCVNVKAKINLQKGEETFVFFGYGKTRFAVSCLNQVEKLCQISKNKCKQTFDVRVRTKNPKFDFFFNENLPKKIWIDWLNGTQNLGDQQKYANLRRLFVRGTQKMSLVNFKEIGLKELGIFNGQYYKKIMVVGGMEKFFKVGKTFFWNVDGITKNSITSDQPLCVCFGVNLN